MKNVGVPDTPPRSAGLDVLRDPGLVDVPLQVVVEAIGVQPKLAGLPQQHRSIV